jgi:hypothetical protein
VQRRILVWTVAALAVIAACGGSDDDDDAAAGDTSSTTVAPADASTTTAPADDGPPGLDGGVDDFDPGDVTYRFVHVAPDFGDVDIYAYTGQGLVQEYLVEEDVGFGTVLEGLRPPIDGSLVVFPAGTTDLDHFSNDALVAQFSTVNVDDEGNQHTLVLAPYDDADGVEVTNYWELPEPALVGQSANALPPAVAGRGLLVAASDAGELTPVYVAAPGAGACTAPQPPASLDLAVGGTSVLAYEVDPGTNELAFHSFDGQDFDCTGGPVLTTSVTVEAGQRVLVLLHQDDAGELAAMALPLA